MSSRFSNLEFNNTPEHDLGEYGSFEAHNETRQQQFFVAHERDSSHHIKLAKKHEMSDLIEEALRSYSAALGEDPLLLDAWIGQLLMLLELGEYKEADLWAGKAAERFPDNPQVWACQSVALHRMGYVRRARELNDMALAGRGQSPTVWICRGELLLGNGKAPVNACFRTAMNETDDHAITGLRVGRTCVRYEQYTVGIEFLEEAVGRSPKGAGLWYYLGLTQEGMGLRREAARSYQTAADLCSANPRYVKCAEQGYNRPDGFINSILRRIIGR